MARKLIIGYEDTPQGQDAVTLGRTLATIADASPIVAAVFTWPQGMMTREDIDNSLAAESRGLFDWALGELEGLAPETRAIADRSIGRSLTELAEREEAVAIVVGSTGRGPLGRILIGSTADTLLHGAPCAIAVAPRGYAEEEEHELRRVAVAYDGSPEAEAAFRTGAHIASHYGSELTLIGVADYPSYGYAAEWSVLNEGEFHDVEREAREEALQRAVSSLPPGLPAAKRLLTGGAGRMLAEASVEFDLMIAGSRAYGPVRRTLLGSATRHLMAAARCPVLVLPREAEGNPFGADADPAGDEREA